MFHPSLFQDQVALVTGGRSGIGFEIARQFLQLGAKVVICSRKAEPLQAATEQLQAYGPCSSLPCDIRKTEDLQALAAHIRAEHGRLDILVNNAGGQFPALSEYINDKGWRAVIENNLNGTFFTTREMANAFFLPQRAGTIVNIIALVSRGFPGMAHTAAARAGVENLTKTLAQEWAAANVRINCVAPGIIDSSGLKTYPPPVQEMLARAAASIPFGRFGTVEEVANTVCFLASPLASYTSGTTLYVDGAQHLNFDNLGLSNLLRSYLEA